MNNTTDMSSVEKMGLFDADRARPPMFFSTPELNQCLDLLLHLIGNSDLLPLLTGDEGAGKTTLLFRLQSKAPEDWVLCRVDAHPMLHCEQLLSQLAHAFGVPEEDDRILDHLLRHFEALSHAGNVPVIVVDDAHLLPVETIGVLLRLHQQCAAAGAGAKTVLFAAPQIEQLLAAPEVQALNFNAFHTLRLLPFSREQTRAFIVHLLAADDRLEGVRRLSDGQVDKIHRESFGSAGRIEYFVTKLILQGPVEQRQPPGVDWMQVIRDIPLPWRVAGGGALVLLLMVLLFQGAINALFTGEGDAQQEAAGEPVASVAVPLALPPVAEQERASVKPLLPPESELVEEPEQLQDLEGQMAPSAAQADALAPPSEAESADVAGQAPIVLAIDAVVDAEADTVKAPAPQQTTEEVLVKDAAPTQAKPKEVVSERPVEQPLADKAATAPVDKPASTVQKKAPVAQQVPEAGAVFAHREDWLRQQKPAAYTLQLLAVQNEPAIRKYIETHRLQGKVAYFQTVRQGQPWFSLVYGVYPDRKAAVAAIAALPPGLERKSVWLRRMGSVHEAIGSR